MATLFVRTVTPGHNFAKEVDINGQLMSLQVHGFDELGRPTMPVFEVPQCEEVVSAIYREPIFDVDEKGTRIPKYTGRLVLVEGTVVNNFPRWIGHPMKGDSLETILNKTKRIREEQIKGDALLGLTEPSTPYTPPVDVMPGFDSSEPDVAKRTAQIEKFENLLKNLKEPEKVGA